MPYLNALLSKLSRAAALALCVCVCVCVWLCVCTHTHLSMYMNVCVSVCVCALACACVRACTADTGEHTAYCCQVVLLLLPSSSPSHTGLVLSLIGACVPLSSLFRVLDPHTSCTSSMHIHAGTRERTHTHTHKYVHCIR